MKNSKMLMSFLAEPNDANYSGNVHGGKVMKWIDEIGYALSVQFTKRYCVTKFVDDIEFLKPINIGDLVKLKAKIIKVGNSSLRIKVDVLSLNLIKNVLKKIVNVLLSLLLWMIKEIKFLSIKNDTFIPFNSFLNVNELDANQHIKMLQIALQYTLPRIKQATNEVSEDLPLFI